MTGGLPELKRKRILADKFEAAGIKVLYDDKYLYVGAVMHDEDVVFLNKKGLNQTFLYRETKINQFVRNKFFRFYNWNIVSSFAAFNLKFV